MVQISPLAGKPAPEDLLVDMDALVKAYYADHPDPADPAQRVSFGTSGHRGSALHARLQRGPHPRDHPGDLRVPQRAGDQRSALHRCRHARPVRACPAFGARSARRPRCGRTGGPRRQAHPHTGDLPRHPQAQPWRRRHAGRRHRRDSVTQPARGRRLQVQPARRRPGGHRNHQLDAGPRQRDPCGRVDRGTPRPLRTGPVRG